jgi:hypothetical protein
VTTGRSRGYPVHLVAFRLGRAEPEFGGQGRAE